MSQISLEPFGFGRHKRLEFLVASLEDHWLVVWFWPTNGLTSIIGLEFRPAIGRGQRPDREAFVDQLSRDCKRRAKELGESKPAALDRSTIVGIPYSVLLDARNHLVQASQNIAEDSDSIAVLPDGSLVQFTKQEQRLLGPLLDAITYTQAIQRGQRNPAQAIADFRTIAPRSAQGRVAKTRSLGLLTSARAGKPGGELTTLAISLKEKLDSLGHRLEGKEGTHGEHPEAPER